MVGNLVRIAGLLAVALPMAVSHASASEEVFKHPKVGGNRLDWCFKFQNGCGEKAANAWCQDQGYKNATSFTKAANVGLTRTIGDSSLCADSHCDSFSQITCFKPPIAAMAALSYYTPTFKGLRLDWCYAWQKQCGKPAAEAFCQSKGHAGVKSFQKAANVGGMTRLISNSQVCDGKCDSFTSIVCE
ncbi:MULTISPECIES: hypothetical protein [unclassified Mesorhizobium]|uniref:hypothetical protein n=1 Tax=unclassified Mesorhizobium TaxID=325217 RepID=UPI000AC7BBA4|nr:MULTISPECIES: hypothetical protein [unclassified Mesorhizobium]MBN9254557.1 hypothetical protein [Mesorhizobium sp.]MBN9271290.1 hypothetical protein [Mesorhizobium sp.]